MVETISYIKSLESLGFVKVLEIQFEVKDEDAPLHKETYYVYFYEKYGIVLTFDTYTGDVNSGDLYYEWIPNNIDGKNYEVTSSGGYTKINDHYIWRGSHDCRRDIRSIINGLKSMGKFQTPWVCNDRITKPKFVHWGDHHTPIGSSWDEGYEKYCKACESQGKERYCVLPENVKVAIGVAYKE